MFDVLKVKINIVRAKG